MWDAMRHRKGKDSTLTQSRHCYWARLRATAKQSICSLALSLAPLAIGACSTSDHTNTDGAVSAQQAVIGTDCGYNITTQVKNVNKKGFKVKIIVTSSNGARLQQPLSVLVNAGSAQIDHVAHGTYQTTSNGYLLTSINPDTDVDDSDEPGEQQDELLGKKYRFAVKFTGTYTQVTAHIISVAGSTCDTVAPTISLTQSGNFFTSNGTLNLTATASDNVAVAQVVFLQDGTQIGVSTTTPYARSVPVTSTLNGRHVYSAIAYDLAGNSASESAGRVLVAINNKFFGTAVTAPVDYAHFSPTFNQVTPGNAGKWGSVEPVQDPNPANWNWTDLDTAYNFAKSNHFPFKLHTLIWGSQQPSWINALSTADQLTAINQWMAAVSARYPNIDMVDVVNEPMHTPPSYIAALGGSGTTGWDWVITAFQLARSYFPNSELLLNDYYVLPLSSFTQNYLTIVNLLKNNGLIDGVAEQGHFYERTPDPSALATNLNTLAATGLPLYISELDLDLADDAQQATRMSQIFPIFWSNPSVVGVTHWGYVQGNTWLPNTYLLLSDGVTQRPALTWLKCYLAGGTNCPVPTYVPQPHTGVCAGITLQAPQFDAANGLLAAGNVVAFASNGSWFSFNRVVFQNTWNSLSVTYGLGSSNSVNLNVYLGSLSSTPAATVTLPPTGSYSTMNTVTTPWTALGSTQDLYFQFSGGGANVSQVQFAAPVGSCAPTNLLPNSNFESGIDGWTGFNATASVTSTWFHSGANSLLGVASSSSVFPNLVRDLSAVVQPGKKYQVSLSFSGGTASSAFVGLSNNYSCGVSAFASVQTGFVGAGAWGQVTGTLDYTVCTASSFTYAQLWVGGSQGATYFIDDVVLIAQ